MCQFRPLAKNRDGLGEADHCGLDQDTRKAVRKLYFHVSLKLLLSGELGEVCKSSMMFQGRFEVAQVLLNTCAVSACAGRIQRLFRRTRPKLSEVERLEPSLPRDDQHLLAEIAQRVSWREQQGVCNLCAAFEQL